MPLPSAALARLPDPSSEDHDIGVPSYLENHYWWAYVRPWAVRFFERAWLVNLILWGWYRALRDAALASFAPALSGRTIQIACCYGDLTPHLYERVVLGKGQLDVIDVLPVQLDNLRQKLPGNSSVNLMQRDSADLQLPTAFYDRALIFFLLHEQPESVRRQTLAEALRVVKPGGQLVLVDFARPVRWHPLRALWMPVLAILEPFAPDLWREDIATWLPHRGAALKMNRETYFGGFYQKIVITVS